MGFICFLADLVANAVSLWGKTDTQRERQTDKQRQRQRTRERESSYTPKREREREREGERERESSQTSSFPYSAGDENSSCDVRRVRRPYKQFYCLTHCVWGILAPGAGWGVALENYFVLPTQDTQKRTVCTQRCIRNPSSLQPSHPSPTCPVGTRVSTTPTRVSVRRTSLLQQCVL